MKKFRNWIGLLGKISLGCLIVTAAFITLFWGIDAKTHVALLWQLLLVSFLCSLGIFMYPSENEQELSKKGLIGRHILYFIFVNIVVLVLGSLFQWFYFSNWKMVVLMELSIIVIFAVVFLSSYLSDAKIAKKLNDKLNQKRQLDERSK